MADDDTSGWRPIDSAPKDEEILVHTGPWGPIIALYNSEFREWMSRMQVPVSIKEEGDLPTHWQPLPASPAPTDRPAEADGASEAADTPVRLVAG